VGLPVAQAALACASQVSTIADELAASATTMTDPTQALSLAHRATAIAQEAVGCALPKPAAVPAGSAGTGDVVASTGGAAPIVEAVTDCLAGLKPSIMQLAEGALSSMDPSAALTLASKAAGLADTAGRCAGNVGTAAQTAFAIPMPASIPVPKVPAMPKFPVPVPAAPLPVAPAAPAPVQPAPAPAPVAATPSWWDAVPYMGGAPTNPAAPWMGTTGQWGDVGQWMPMGPWMPF
jgi:2-oxoglutarate dehydrogenase E2 component (dihydrolipoamide succinyltransferase)